MKIIHFRGEIPFNSLRIEEYLRNQLPHNDFPLLIATNSKVGKDDKIFKTKILLLIEPNSVMPELYESCQLEKFDLVLPMSPWRAMRMGISTWLYQPYSWTSSKPNYSNRKPTPVMVAASKFGNSERSLYWLRRKLISLMDKNNIQIDVYGPDWNMKKGKELRMRLFSIRQFIRQKRLPRWRDCFELFGYRPKNYMGIVKDKGKLLGEYSTSVVIENDLDALSEKLFDCLQSGVVPIYVGPNLSSFAFLESALIRAESNLESLTNLILKIDQLDFDTRRKAITFLHDNPELLSSWALREVEQEFKEKIVKFCKLRFSLSLDLR